LFVQKVKGFNTRELVYFLRTNPQFAQAIGFDPIYLRLLLSLFKRVLMRAFSILIICVSILILFLFVLSLTIKRVMVNSRIKKCIILILSKLTLALNLFLTLNLFTIITVIKSNLFLISVLKLIRFLFLMSLFLPLFLPLVITIRIMLSLCCIRPSIFWIFMVLICWLMPPQWFFWSLRLCTFGEWVYRFYSS